MRAVELIRIDFDNMENTETLERTSLGLFIEGDGLSPEGKICDFLYHMDKVKVYKGWNKQFYPQFIIEEKKIN